MRRYLPFVLIALVLLLTVGAGYLFLRSRMSPTAVPAKLAAGRAGAEPAHVRGSAIAKVTLEEFGDFQCIQCGAVAKTLKKLEEDYGTRLRVIFREYPLQQHLYGRDAACAAEAAGLQGHFWEMHDLLYENAPTWSKGAKSRPSLFSPDLSPSPSPDARAAFESYAGQLGLDLERFKRDMDGEQVKARLRADLDRAASLNVDRTPTLFLNGHHVAPTSRTVDALHTLIDAELAGKTP